MEIRVSDNYETMGAAAADYMADLVAAKPDASIVLPTGNSPLGLYVELIAKYQRDEFDPSRLCIFQREAYLRVSPTDPRSVYARLERDVLIPLELGYERVIRLPATPITRQRLVAPTTRR